MRFARPLALFLATAGALGSLSGLGVAFPSSAAAADIETCDRTENSDDRTIPREFFGNSGTRCISGVELNVRGYLAVNCIYDTIEPLDSYQAGECGGNGRGVEAIAQARLIANLNDKKYGWYNSIRDGINPGIQWELNQVRQDSGPFNQPVSAGRPDLVLYDYEDPTAILHIYEVKRWENPDAQGTGDQMERYRNWWVPFNVITEAGGADQIDEYTTNEVGDAAAYTDHFVLETEDDTCELYGVEAEDRENLSLNGEGAVWIDQLGGSDECSYWDTLKRYRLFGLFPLPAPYSGRVTIPEVTRVLPLAATGAVRGDPHLVTLDGTAYDVQAAGEFILLDSPAIGGQVQGRFEPLGDNASVLTSTAFSVNGHRVEIRPSSDTPLLIDGEVVNLPEDVRLELGSGAYLGHAPNNQWLLAWPSENRDDPPVAVLGGAEGLQIHLPAGASSVGLLGDTNGDPADDLRYPNGSQLITGSPAELNGAFADAWRITQTSSLFSYDSGESTSTYTDLNHPSGGVPASVDDYTQADRQAASDRCTALGLPVGFALDSCVLDLLVTGDERFLQAHATALRPALAIGVSSPGPDGQLTATFDQAEPSNLSPPRRSEDTSGISYAGPFVPSDTYSPYTYGPVHETYDLTFDLMTIGAWGNGGSPQVVEVRYGPEADDVWRASFSRDVNGNLVADNTDVGGPAVSGVLQDGQSYSVLPVSITVPDSAGSGATFSFRGMSTTSGILAGLDNLTFSFPVQDAQTFDAQAAFTSGGALDIPGDSLGAGSGELEAVTSSDIYTFSTTTTSPLRVDWSSGPGGYPLVSWSLRAAGSSETIAGGRVASDASTDPLPPGSYEFVVAAADATSTGPYEFALFPVPEPDTGTLTLTPGVPTAVEDGVPFTGAGNLESSVSTDIYSFTVPSGSNGVYLDWKSGPAGGIYAYWELTNTAGDHIRSGVGTAWDERLPDLSPGTYTLTVSPYAESTGPYSFALVEMDTDRASSSLPLNISQGLPSAGSGRLETGGSVDEYVFSIPASTTALRVDWADGPGGSPLVDWSLTDESSGLQIADGWTASDAMLDVEGGRSYRLSVSARDADTVGAYALSVLDVTPQTFTVGLPATVTPGSPASGAGRLETQGSTDTYTVELTGNIQGLYLDWLTVQDGLGQAEWDLTNVATGESVMSGVQVGDLFDRETDLLPAGFYKLTVRTYNDPGAYAFTLLPKTVDSGTVSLPAQISPDAPFPGAGNLADPANSDTYTFTLPTTGSVLVDWINEPTNAGGLVDWTIVDTTTGTTVLDESYPRDRTLTDLPAGTYRLEVRPWDAGRTGTYTLNLSVNPTPQTFPLTLPASVSDGMPAAGAGNLETAQSKDVYTFSVPAGGQSIMMDWVSGPGGGSRASWQLIDAETNTQLRSGDLALRSYSPTFTDLPAGSYRIEVKQSQYASDIGAYRFDLLPVVVDSGTVTLPTQISPDAPFPGAGNLADPANSDTYTFTLPTTGSVLVDWINEPTNAGGLVDWTIVDTTTGTTVLDESYPRDRTLTDLPAGTYRLEVRPWDAGRTGTYTLNLSVLGGPQTFATNLPVTISDGVPAAGAGNLETAQSKDVYTFTVPTGTSPELIVDWLASPNGRGLIDHKLINATTGVQVFSSANTFDRTTAPLEPGTYRFEASVYAGSSDYTGAYSVNLRFRPAPDQFVLTLPAIISNGSPSSGAGNLETLDSRDSYTFSVPAGGGRLVMDWVQGPANQDMVDTQLVNTGTGAVVASSPFAYDTVTSSLAAGTYRLVVSANQDAATRFGTYRLNVALDTGPQVVPVTLPVTVSDGVPTAGAGNLESIAATDAYTFTVPTGASRELIVDWITSPNGRGLIDHKLINVTSGVQVFSSANTFDRVTSPLPPGTYRFEASVFAGSSDYTGAYSVDLRFRPAPTEFAIAVPSALRPGSAGTGSGRLQTAGEIDSYAFAVPSGASQSVRLDWGAGGLTVGTQWTLLDVATGSSVQNGTGSQTFTSLAAGVYKLQVRAGNAFDLGDYSFDLSFVTSGVTAGQPMVADDFERVVGNGLGVAPLGGSWTGTATAGRLSVSDGSAHITSSAGQTTSANLAGVSATDATLRYSLDLTGAPTGAGVYMNTVVRRVSAQQYYQARFIIRSNGTVAAFVTYTNGSTETQIGNQVVVPNLTLGSGDVLNVEVTVSGTSPTTIALTTWKEGTAKPSAPSVTRTDSTSYLQTSGSIGLAYYLSGSATSPVTVNMRGFAVHSTR